MSGTPLQDRVKEIYIILNLLLPYQFNDYEKFKSDFVENDKGQLIPPEYLREAFKLVVSHYSSKNKSDFPEVKTYNVTVPMSSYQYENYLIQRADELSVSIPDKKLAQTNPRRYDSMKTRYFLSKIMYKSLGECNCSYPEYAKDKEDKLVEDGGWIDEEFIKNILQYAPKIYVILVMVTMYQAKHMIFTRYVKKHGVDLISSLLTYFNIPHLIFSGEAGSDEKRQEIIEKFNSPENINGEIYRVLIFTRAGSEGLNIFQVRFFYALEQYMRTYLLQQAKGRAERLGSHKLLPENMRDLAVLELFSITPGDNISFCDVPEGRKTSDFFSFEEAQRKKNRIQLIIDMLNEI